MTTPVLKRFDMIMQELKPLDDMKHIVLLFSGGKDCSVLLHLLCNAFPDRQINAIMAVFPKHMYSHSSLLEIERFWVGHNVNLTVLATPDEDPNQCTECKSVRKSLIAPVLTGYPFSETVLFSGYTFDDCVAYIDRLRILTDSTYRLDLLPSNTRLKVLSDLVKFQHLQETPGQPRICRPLIDFHWIELAGYLEAHQIPYVTDPCRLYSQKYKRIHQERLEQQYGQLRIKDLVELLAQAGILIPESLVSEDEGIDFFPDC